MKNEYKTFWKLNKYKHMDIIYKKEISNIKQKTTF